MRRFSSLDSLRGVAAMIVVVHHLVATVPGLRERLWSTYVARPFVMGPSAVDVFFVLSGLVLYLTFDGKDGFRYRPYVIKRVCRIYLPLVVAILCSATLFVLLRPGPVAGVSWWFNARSWSQPLTAKLLVGHLLMIDPWRYGSLDNVIWSLVHEMRISLVFPLLAWGLNTRTWPSLALATITSVAAYWATMAGYVTRPIDLIPTAAYLALFACGGTIAKKQAVLRGWFRTPARVAAGVAMLVAGIAGLCCDSSALLVSIGSVLTVLACFAVPPVEAALRHASLVWLGRVSYSLYLFHLPVLLTLVHLFAARVPLALLLPAVIPLALVAAELAFRLVERPAIALGRSLAARC